MHKTGINKINTMVHSHKNLEKIKAKLEILPKGIEVETDQNVQNKTEYIAVVINSDRLSFSNKKGID